MALNLFDEIRNNPKYSPTQSVSWFIQNVRALASFRGIGPLSILGQNVSMQTSAPKIGSMFLFTYSPKHKETLPVYDTVPLVVPFSIDGTSFKGINFHYIHPRIRIALLQKLVVIQNEKVTPRHKAELTWETLRSAAGHSLIAPAVKMYLFKHVKSRLMEVAPDNWPMAIMLPLERFKKQTNDQVWGVSR